MVLDTCAANHGPTARKPVSPKVVSRISQEYFRVQKSATLKILRRSFEQRQVSPGRERIYFRQFFPVRERVWSFRYRKDSGLSGTGEILVSPLRETLWSLPDGSTLVSPGRERLRSLPYGRDPTVSRTGDIVQDIPMESGLVGFSLTRGESYSVC